MVGNWEYAYERCLEQNMTLSTIETQQEDKMIDDFFQLNHGKRLGQHLNLTSSLSFPPFLTRVKIRQQNSTTGSSGRRENILNSATNGNGITMEMKQ
jgi:hypothetical protein